jgi:hypothetical protein
MLLRKVAKQLYSYLWIEYEFVMKAHESSHIPEGIYANKKKTNFDED